MKIRQLSVFVENRVGAINELVSILSKANINMRAFSLAESVEFGILRLVVDDVDYAIGVISEAGFTVNTTDVVCVKLPNTAGGLSELIDCLAREQVFIKYMYAYSEGDVASTVIRPNDIDRCVEVLEKCRGELIAKNLLYSF